MDSGEIERYEKEAAKTDITSAVAKLEETGEIVAPDVVEPVAEEEINGEEQERYESVAEKIEEFKKKKTEQRAPHSQAEVEPEVAAVPAEKEKLTEVVRDEKKGDLSLKMLNDLLGGGHRKSGELHSPTGRSGGKRLRQSDSAGEKPEQLNIYQSKEKDE